ncbi:MAG: hypothetical protein EOO51_08330 [Flavobacterium sp.]|nr:MAG: hypothetical protein EOO51_08330 [Flavobacterium sp.]
MNLQDQIDFGSLTLSTLTKLITSNEDLCKKLNVKMTWKFAGKKVLATVSDGDKIIFNRYFSKPYTHLNLAQMHLDWNYFLKDLQRKRNPTGSLHPLKGARAAGMNVGGNGDIHPDYI